MSITLTAEVRSLAEQIGVSLNEPGIDPRLAARHMKTQHGSIRTAYKDGDLRPLHLLPEAKEKPDTKPVRGTHLIGGEEYGWLTVQSTTFIAGTPVLCRCRCGAVVSPTAHDVARGAFRSCGSLNVHGIH